MLTLVPILPANPNNDIILKIPGKVQLRFILVDNYSDVYKNKVLDLFEDFDNEQLSIRFYSLDEIGIEVRKN